MPIVEITLIEGRTYEDKSRLVTEVIREVPAHHFAAGGVLKEHHPKQPDCGGRTAERRRNAKACVLSGGRPICSSTIEFKGAVTSRRRLGRGSGLPAAVDQSPENTRRTQH